MKSYKSNCLADAQLFAAKYSINSKVKIPQPILDWAADNSISIEDVISENNYYILDGRDSMNHVMKGNIVRTADFAGDWITPKKGTAYDVVMKEACETWLLKN